MTFKSEIEQYLEQIYTLEESFRKVKDMDILPLSFFSSSIDILNKLKAGIHEMESAQFQMMLEHLKERGNEAVDILSKPVKETVVEPQPEPEPDPIEEPAPAEPGVIEPETEQEVEEPEPVSPRQDEVIEPVMEVTVTKETIVKETASVSVNPAFLADKITKKLYADLKKSLSLNDKFRFQRDLFKGNAVIMNDALEQLNAYTRLDEALQYLNSEFQWDWESESAQAFRELLERRFIE